jgi:hypothetical protein
MRTSLLSAGRIRTRRCQPPLAPILALRSPHQQHDRPLFSPIVAPHSLPRSLSRVILGGALGGARLGNRRSTGIRGGDLRLFPLADKCARINVDFKENGGVCTVDICLDNYATDEVKYPTFGSQWRLLES